MKHTIETVKTIFEAEGCKVTDNEYNYKNKINYICSCGTPWATSLQNFKKGKRCRNCGNKKNSEKRIKYSLLELQEIFLKEGAEYLEGKPFPTNKKVKYRCVCGNISNIKIHHFINGIRCGCRHKNASKTLKSRTDYEIIKNKIKESLKADFEMVKQEFLKEGYTVLSKEYINARTSLSIKCPKGHITNTLTWSAFHNRGNRCNICFGKIRYSQEEIKSILSIEGYKPLSSYKNAGSRLIIECPKGHEWHTNFDSYKYGTRCPFCRGTRVYVDYKELKQKFEERNYQLLSGQEKITGVSSNVKYFCNNCNERRKIQIKHFLKGVGCKKCASKRNSGENNYRWNPNRTWIQRRKNRNSPEDKEWRVSIFIRDDRTCQACGYKGNKKVAHHIKSWRDYPHLRYEKKNGITLCIECHKEFHGEFGYINFTEEQLKLFLFKKHYVNVFLNLIQKIKKSEI